MTTPEPLTLHPTPATPTDPGPWTYEMVDMAFEAVPGSQVRRCPCCYAAGEDTYYLDPWGDTHCAACIATCPYCYEAPAVVSARVQVSDPSMQGEVELAAREGRQPRERIDHVCESCLSTYWAPGEILSGPTLSKVTAVSREEVRRAG